MQFDVDTQDRCGVRLARWAASASVAVAACLTALAAAGPATAAGGHDVLSFDATLSDYQAGGHPDATTSFRLQTEDSGLAGLGDMPCLDLSTFTPVVCQQVKGGVPKDVTVDAPKGLVGNPSGIPQCSVERLVLSEASGGCGTEHQVGVAVGHVVQFGHAPRALAPARLFNLRAEWGEVARLGFLAEGTVPVSISVRLRSDGDYGISAVSENIYGGLPLVGADITIWGVPGAPANDDQRCSASAPTGAVGEGSCSSSLGLRPFLTAPSECGVDGVPEFGVRSYQAPGDGDWTRVSGSVQRVVGCDDPRIRFEPRIDLRPDTRVADAPMGLEVRVGMDHELEDPDALGTPPLRDVEVRLPEGVSINPASAGGLVGCSDEQLGIGTKDDVGCPAGSRIGEATARTPVLDDVLSGGVFVRSQASGDPASGEMFRIALVLENEERGLSVRLPGRVFVDAGTGRITTRFEDNPQLPVSEIVLRLKGGPRAPLASPAVCGRHVIETSMSSWGGQSVERQSTFTIDCPGQGGFSPAFDAGTMSPVGGSFSSLVARVARPDGQEPLSGVEVDLPRGLSAKLAGVELCPDAVAGDGTAGVCPAGSRIGTVTVGAGAGRPFHLTGEAYLTGPYKGAPYGLSVQVPAKAGPFDLGMVKVRQQVLVDRRTAGVRVVSDPLPQVVKGVPVRLRDVHVNVDRPGFAINPTSCREQRVQARLTSTAGAVHETGRRFQVADCQALAFRPRLGLRLTGKNQRTTGKHPGVRAVVRQSGIGEAGVERARVTLPRSVALDPDNAQALCEYVDGIKPDLEDHCPKASIVGRARAKTPLLNDDLDGDVYFVKNVERNPKTGALIRKLPMIVVALRGEIAINLVGKSSTSRDNRLVNTFASVPDAPITQFNLTIKGGKTGILAVTRTRRAKINLCTEPDGHIANNQMDGHNGKRADYRTRVKTPCPNHARAKRSGGNRR